MDTKLEFLAIDKEESRFYRKIITQLIIEGWEIKEFSTVTTNGKIQSWDWKLTRTWG